MVATWMGVPLDELPREVLTQALIDTCCELDDTRRRCTNLSVAHTLVVAALGRERLHAQRPWLMRLFSA